MSDVGVYFFTQRQVEGFAKQVGFPAADAEIAAAVFMAESVTWINSTQYENAIKIGDVALQTDVWGPSVGIPQIRTMKADLNRGSFYDYNWLYGKPLNQMRAAYYLWKTRGFQPWSAFNNGSYKGYMQTAVLNPVPTVPANQHLILGGESLSIIAALPKYKGRFSWRALALANDIKSPYYIYAGKSLNLPVWEYKVSSGDTLTKIATTYTQVSWEQLAAFNKLANPNNLSVGQVLLVPDPTFLEGATA